MKKECEQTRKQLRRFLRGHVFTTERIRIERHLKACVLCATEYQSLKRANETTKFLKDITPSGGVIQRVKSGVSGLSGIKKILYRPLWIIIVAAAVFAMYQYVLTPYLREQEREWQELTAPSMPQASTATASPSADQPKQPEAIHTKKKAAPAVKKPAPAAKKPDALVVTITVEGQTAVRRINEVMRGHEVLRAMRFSDTVTELSTSLTEREIRTFFNRIEPVARISYRRSRLKAFPSAEPLPVVMKLKIAPRPVPKPVERQEPPPAPVEPPSKPEAEAPSAAAPAAPADQSVPVPAAEAPPAQ